MALARALPKLPDAARGTLLAILPEHERQAVDALTAALDGGE